MLHGQLKHCHNFISFLDRVNDENDFRFSGTKFQSWLALEGIEVNPYLFEVGMWVSKTLNCHVF